MISPSFTQQLDLLLRARCHVVVVTQEEERLLALVAELCRRGGRSGYAWDLAEGFVCLTADRTPVPVAGDPKTALEVIDQAPGSGLYLLRDFHDSWSNPLIRRKLRSVAQRLRSSAKSLLISIPGGQLPAELRDELLLLEMPLPSAVDLEAVLDRFNGAAGTPGDLTDLGREKLVQAALGLTVSQAQRAFARALLANQKLDDRSIDLVMEEKRQILRESQALEYFPLRETSDDVGGLGALKEWLRLRERIFGSEARTYGLPMPKGIALLGIPGTGKSLSARMVGAQWRLPLLRLDVGALFGSLVGESEARVRQALRLAEAVAPCVLWIDELEKSLSHGGLDSGTSDRVFGTLLTWMQEKTAPCFVVATANDISSLPPELLRKGRFDEIFFLDLPNRLEREEIFAIHLKRRKRLALNFDLPRLALASAGLVGAEIEQAIGDAMIRAFNENREFDTSDVEDALRTLVPLSVTQREIVSALRAWLHEGRAQAASHPDPATA
jgi:SpoVK/Ycf46/Vps4 family AAA+-type ATPase